MKRILKKIRSIKLSSSTLIFVAIFTISIFGFQVSKISAQQQQNSILGGPSNGLVVQGASILANIVGSNGTGLAVLNGRTGLGTAYPDAKLHLKQSSGELVIRMENTDPSFGHNWELNSKANGAFSIIDRSMGADRIFIKSDGNVGIGTTNPAYTKLVVKGGGIRIENKPTISNTFDVPLQIFDGFNVQLMKLSYDGNLDLIGDANISGSLVADDVVSVNNKWGACTYIQKHSYLSCEDSWGLLCSEGEFMRGVHNNGGKNTCPNAIYCCKL